MVRVREMTMKKQNANGVWQVEASLVADAKSEVGAEMSVSGLPSNSELILGSYVITTDGDVGIIDSAGEWHWVGEEDEPASTLSLNKPAVTLTKPSLETQEVEPSVDEIEPLADDEQADEDDMR